MTKKELENLVLELQSQLAASKQPSTIRQFWDRVKPYLVPFILGAMLGGIVTYSAVCGLPTVSTQTTLEQKAASGGAVIPFPSGSPSPSHSSLLPSDSKAEVTAGVKTPSWTNTSEPPLPKSPQADNGQTPSTRFYRLPLRRTQ